MSGRPPFSRQFHLLCLSSLLFFASFNFVIAELPAWLDALGGKEHLGLVIALFTLTALLVRPLSGHLADRIGRLPVIVFGVGVSLLCALLYPFALSLGAFFAVRLVHGLSTGFAPTGTTALMADILPVGRRGEGLGILGLSGSIGMALGPWLGGLVAREWGHTAMFLGSAGLALVSIALFLGMRETLPHRQRFGPGLLVVPRRDLLEPLVWRPALATLFCLFPFGAVLTLAPDLSEQAGLANKGTFFLYYVLTSVLVRFPSGRLSDRVGRRWMMLAGSLLLGAAMFVVAGAGSRSMVLLGAVLTGMASGINAPVIFAWTTDLAHPEHRARAMATTFIALELGIGLGALVSGRVYAGEAAGLATAFRIAGLVALAGSAFLLVAGSGRPGGRRTRNVRQVAR